MPLDRLSDRLSFGVDSDVDDTMMDIIANRAPVDDASFGDYGFDEPPMDEFTFISILLNDSDDTVDLRADIAGEGEYTATLARHSSPPIPDLQLPLHLQLLPKQTKKYTPQVSEYTHIDLGNPPRHRYHAI
jgi:hypothetical protein